MARTYPPLTDVKKRLKINWYRCPIDTGTLKHLAQRSDIRGLAQSLGFLTLIVLTGGFTYYFFERELWLAFGLVLFVHGSIYSFIPGIVTHELSHGTVFRAKWLNAFFLRLFSIIAWVNFHQYKRSHTYHHQYTLYPDGDREVVLPRNPSLKVLFLFFQFTLNIPGIPVRVGTNILSLAFLKRFREKGEWTETLYPESDTSGRRTMVRWARLVVLFHLVLVALSVVFGLWPLPIIITLASFIANWWRYLVVFAQHTGLRDEVPDFRKCCRSTKLDPFTQFLYWHMNFHTEHHMYAAVPCYNLGKLAREIAWDMPNPRTVISSWREMRETARKQKLDPAYQFDTPVPDNGINGRPVDEIGTAIGDLAND